MQRRNARQEMEAGNEAGLHLPNKVPLTPHLKNVFEKMLDDLSAGIDLLPVPARHDTYTSGKLRIKETLANRYKFRQPKTLLVPARIPAGFDQISFSLYVNNLPPNEVLNIFTEKLGEPEMTYDRHWHHFSNGLKLSRMNMQFHHSLRFSNLAVLQDLEPLRKIFPSKDIPGSPPRPAFLLSSAEVKFDYHLPGLKYEEAESIMQALASLLLLRNKYAELKIQRGKKFKKRGNNVYNGKLGFSFGKLRKLEYEDEKPEKGPGYQSPSSLWQINSYADFHGKVYLKSFDNKQSWNIRIEVTLKDNALRKIGGKRLPENLISLQNRLARLCFNDFWKTEIFDREAFLNEAWPIYEVSKGQPQSMKKTIRFAAMLSEDNQYTIRQKRLAKKFAKTLDSNKLLRHLDKGKFSKALALIDMLSKKPSGK